MDTQISHSMMNIARIIAFGDQRVAMSQNGAVTAYTLPVH